MNALDQVDIFHYALMSLSVQLSIDSREQKFVGIQVLKERLLLQFLRYKYVFLFGLILLKCCNS